MTTRTIAKTDPLHRFLAKRISARVKYSESKRSDQIKKWSMAEDAATAYLPESEVDAARRNDRDQRGNPHYTTIQIPYSYAILMAMHTYLTSVFFARSPVHQFSGRHGETEQQTQALEALVSYQVESGGHLVPYYIWIYDSCKYGAGILGNYWCEESVQYSSIEELEVADPMAGIEGMQALASVAPAPVLQKVQQTFRSQGFVGNKVFNVDPFTFGHDPHVPLGRFQDGEYCWVKKMIGWNEVIKRKYSKYYMNVEELKTGKAGSSAVTSNYSESSIVRPEKPGPADQSADDETHPTSVEIYEFHIELIPKEWKLGSSEYPEKWVFTITSDFATIIGAEPLGCAHALFPFDVIQTEVEGYALYTRGMPEIVRPLQNTMDWLLNSHFFNVRAALNNQFIIDPSKIVVDDAEDGGPGFIYSLRPEAYGSDVRSFFYQIPVQDFTRAHMNDLQTMQQIGEMVTGINDQMFGALGGGGRKTATEIRTSTGFGTNRLKTIAEFISAQGMSPMAQKFVANSQQFYDAPLKLKIVGDLAQMAGPAFMQVTPELIAGCYDFVPVDGSLPVDRMAMATLWQTLMGNMTKIPGLLQQFDVSKIFTYVAQLMGIRNVNQFKVQVLPDQQLLAQAAAGNVIPLKPPGGGVAPGAPTGVSKQSGVAPPDTGGGGAALAGL